MGKLADAYQTFKSSVYWNNTKRWQGYGVANSGEAAKVDAYVAALDAGQSPTPPVLATAFGIGLIGIVEALRSSQPPPPPPPPPPEGKWPFRSIYVTDADFAGCHAVLGTMGLNSIEAQIFAGTTNIKARMDQLAEGETAWSMLGGFAPSVTGGSFTFSDAAIEAIIGTIKDHPRNSHRYFIDDEPKLAGVYTDAVIDLNRASLRARRNLVKKNDPLAIVSVSEYKQTQIAPSALRPHGFWGGTDPVGAAVYMDRVVDELWLSTYPNQASGYQTTWIPDIASWCDAASVPFLGSPSCHDYLSSVVYPTQATFDRMIDQWYATNADGIVVYIYNDGEGSKQLRDDPAMQAHIGAKLATVA